MCVYAICTSKHTRRFSTGGISTKISAVPGRTTSGASGAFQTSNDARPGPSPLKSYDFNFKQNRPVPFDVCKPYGARLVSL